MVTLAEVRRVVRAEVRAALAERSPAGRVVTVSEAARHYQVSRQAIHNWIREGKLARVARPGRRVYVHLPAENSEPAALPVQGSSEEIRHV